MKHLITSKAFIGLTIVHVSSCFGIYLFLTQLPTYMKEILKFDIKTNGALSALPYLAFWLVTIVSSMVGDKLIQKNILSKTNVRKLATTLSAIIPAASIVILSFMTSEEPVAAVILLVIGLSFKLFPLNIPLHCVM